MSSPGSHTGLRPRRKHSNEPQIGSIPGSPPTHSPAANVPHLCCCETCCPSRHLPPQPLLAAKESSQSQGVLFLPDGFFEQKWGKPDLKALDFMSFPIWILDPRGGSVWWANRTALRIWGLSSVSDLADHAEKDPPLCRHFIPRLDHYLHEFKQNRVVVDVVGLTTPTETFPMQCQVCPILVEEDELGFAESTTTMLLVGGHVPETTPRDFERVLCRAYEQTSVCVAVWSLSGQLLTQNRPDSKYFGARRGVGGSEGGLHSVFVNRSEGMALWQGLMQTGGPCEGEYRLNTTFGECWMAVKVARTPCGGVDAVVSTCEDISVRVAAVEARVKAEAANRAKSEFLAAMSHDIRTPMASVVGYMDLLRETEVTPLQMEYIEVVQNAARVMVNILNDILDVSKMEAGKFALETVGFVLKEVCVAASNVVVHTLRAKGVAHSLTIAPELAEARVQGDPTRLSQILINLLSNAAKFTYAGKVTLDVSLMSIIDNPKAGPHSSANEKAAIVRFDVTDTGIGIQKENLDKLFEKFSQESLSVARSHGGVGLGLYLCKTLTEMMGGEIHIESEPGKGSRIWFTACLGLDLDDAYDIMEEQGLQPYEIREVSDDTNHVSDTQLQGAAMDTPTDQASEAGRERRPSMGQSRRQRVRRHTRSPDAELHRRQQAFSNMIGQTGTSKEPINVLVVSTDPTVRSSAIELIPTYMRPYIAISEFDGSGPDLLTRRTLRTYDMAILHCPPSQDGTVAPWHTHPLLVQAKYKRPKVPPVSTKLILCTSGDTSTQEDAIDTPSDGMLPSQSNAPIHRPDQQHTNRNAPLGGGRSRAPRREGSRHGVRAAMDLRRGGMSVDSEGEGDWEGMGPSNGDANVPPQPSDTAVRAAGYVCWVPACVPASKWERDSFRVAIDGVLMPLFIARTHAKATSSLRVLLAEDNAVNRRLILTMLQKAGHSVDAVCDGEEAVDKVAQVAREGLLYDVILMDIHMPKLNGIEATRAIRSMEGAAAHVPIIALTASAMTGDRESFLAQGMNGYLAKPIEWKSMTSQLQQFAHPTTSLSVPPSNSSLGSPLTASPTSSAPPSPIDTPHTTKHSKAQVAEVAESGAPHT